MRSGNVSSDVLNTLTDLTYTRWRDVEILRGIFRKNGSYTEEQRLAAGVALLRFRKQPLFGTDYRSVVIDAIETGAAYEPRLHSALIEACVVCMERHPEDCGRALDLIERDLEALGQQDSPVLPSQFVRLARSLCELEKFSDRHIRILKRATDCTG